MNNVVKTKNKDASNFFIAGEIWVEVRFFFEIMPDGTIRDSGVYQFISLQIYSIKRFEFNLKRKIEFLLRCKILEGSGFLFRPASNKVDSRLRFRRLAKQGTDRSSDKKSRAYRTTNRNSIYYFTDGTEYHIAYFEQIKSPARLLSRTIPLFMSFYGIILNSETPSVNNRMNPLSFFRKSAPSAPFAGDDAARMKLYRKLRFQSFIAGTVGYSLYYVCRTSLNVVKKPILESGALDATQLGIIGSALLFAYAIGKFVNGFIADYCNIKRFMATGLILSAAVNALMGLLGLAHSVVPTAVIFAAFAVMWGLNGWAQSMGAPPAIISLSRWYPLRERGTYYGFFSASHNLGEFFSFLFVGSIVTFAGWQAGFFGSALAGAIGVVIVLCWLHDTPESKGLPPVEALAHEKPAPGADKSVREIQKQVLRTPAVWVLAAASAFMYISRYAINGWGVLFLQEAKGFSDVEAISVVSINALLGILGTVLSGWFSDKLFKGDRKIPALLFGILNSLALVLFLYGGNAMWVNVLSMVLFGIAIGVLICFLGGLMAVDIVPRKATGAALGVVGIASYIAAGIQDVASGWLIDSHITVATDGAKHYDFGPVALFWIAASVISFLLPLMNRKQKTEA